MQEKEEHELQEAPKTCRVLAVIPAFEEAANLPGLLSAFARESGSSAQFTIEILVIDDGSSDDTFQVAQRFPGARSIRLPINLGIGGAVQTGLIFALRNAYDAAVQVDGDGQHRPEYISSLYEAMKKYGADVVVASRFVKTIAGFRSTWLRRLGIQLLGIWCWLLTGKRIYDITSGFRMFNRRAITLLVSSYPQDYPEPASMVTLLKEGMKVVEIPIRMEARKAGRSSIGPLHSIYYMAKVAWAMFIESIKRVN